MTSHGLSVHRFLSKREKHGRTFGKHHGRDRESQKHQEEHKEKPIAQPISKRSSSLAQYRGLFNGPEKAADSKEEEKVKTLRRRVVENKSVIINDSQILWSLQCNFSDGEVDRAFDLLLAMSNSSEGLIMDYDPSVKLLGAANRRGVTCFLDATLFAMFSRLDSFEAMLYNTFQDAPRNKLALLLRIWVNLLRSGKLITTDITKLLQESLAECGWEEAAEVRQHDASEAFTFITGKLELPLLTLKMDIYHTGKEDANDDHKFINERLLEVAIPSDSAVNSQAITLEDCLETYFNNRIEVRRYLERRSTLSSTRSNDSSKANAVHVESVEFDPDSSPTTPLSSLPSNDSSTRHRAPSIIQQRFIPDRQDIATASTDETNLRPPDGRPRKGSIRKEVMMPAWQFFSLIPWYTDNAPSSDAQVAAHFSSKRPMLGMCLKRYSMTARGKAVRLNTRVDIPIEIGLPHFIQDDHMEDDGPIHGNFKLSLQSVVCHRGVSVDSGHYIALVIGTTTDTMPSSTSASSEDAKHWMRFDDLASQRITLVDIEKALKEETPYLLFYQIVPISGESAGEGPPGYPNSNGHDSGVAGLSMTSLSLKGSNGDNATSGRPSFEVTDSDESARGRSPVLEARRASVTFSEHALKGPDLGPSAQGGASRSRFPSRRGSKSEKNGSHARSQSQASDRYSKAISRLAGFRSKEALPVEVHHEEVEITIREASTVSSLSDDRGKLPPPRLGKREKSKNRLGKGFGTSGKVKGERPDRECIMM